MTDRTQPEALRLADEVDEVARTYPDMAEVSAELRRQHARIAELESIGAGGVNGPLMGQPQAMPDLSALTDRGAKAWAGVDAQGLREGRWYMVTHDGVATLCEDRRDAEKEAKDADMAWPHSGPHRAVQLVEASTAGFTAADMATASAQGFRDGVASLSANAGEPMFWVRLCGDGLYEGPIHNARIEEVRKQSGVWSPLYLAAPPTAQAEGWISVDEQLPEPNVEVLCAGQGWGNAFVTACYYDDERREWHPINTHWTDATGQAQYPTHWMPLPLPPTSAEGV